METSASDLKATWIRVVRTLIGVEDYRVGKSWDATFERAAAELAQHPKVSAEDLVTAQVKYVIGINRPILFPNLLLGEGAYARLSARPDPGSEVLELSRFYATQVKSFMDVADTMGEDYALQDRVSDRTPLALAYLYDALGREVPPDILRGAWIEYTSEPLLKQVLPSEFFARIFP